MHPRVTSALCMLALLVAGAPIAAVELTLPLVSLDRLGPLIIGESTEADVIGLLGEPEEKQRGELPPYPPARPTATPYLVLKYPSRGVEISLNLSNEGRMMGGSLSRPFASSPDDKLRLGMTATELFTVLEERFGPIAASAFDQNLLHISYHTRLFVVLRLDSSRLLDYISLQGERKLTDWEVALAEEMILEWKSPTPAELRMRGLSSRERAMILSYEPYKTKWEQFRFDGWLEKAPLAGELNVVRIEGGQNALFGVRVGLTVLEGTRGIIAFPLEVIRERSRAHKRVQSGGEADFDLTDARWMHTTLNVSPFDVCTLNFSNGMLTENSCQDRELLRLVPIVK